MNLPTKISEFIQQQIEERQKSGLIELQNAKLAIENDGLRLKEDVRTLMTEQQRTLRELNIYKWAIRFVFVMVLGGSILGAATYLDYMDRRVDRRIAERAIKTDRLILAVTYGYSYQWRRSLLSLDKILQDPTFSDLDPDFKSALFINYLWVLGQIEDQQADGSWVGDAEWKRLNSDRDFVSEFITGSAWEHDSDVNNSLGFCTLKYSSEDSLLTTARNYFQKAVEDAKPEQKKAPHLFGLAMIDLIEGDQKAAIAKLRRAEELEPSEYRIEDLFIYRNSFMNRAEFKVWEGVARRVKGENFGGLYEQLLKTASAPRNKSNG